MTKAEQFIQDCTKNCSNELCSVEDRYGKKVISYHEWLTPEQALRAVEIAKEEAIDWLEKHSEQSNNEEAEKEKNDYVSGKFLYCKGSFNEFKEGKSYWLEYVGNDNYVGRSDNILNQKFHITPRQLYTLLTPIHDCEQLDWSAIKGQKDTCKGCNNVKGCLTCVDGSEKAKI